MKPSKTSWILLTVGIFAVLAASLGSTYSNQLEERKQVMEELSVAAQRLGGIQLEPASDQRSNLEAQLSQAMSQLEDIRAMFLLPTGSLAACDSILDITDKCSVELTRITTPGLTSDDLEGIEILSILLTMKVEGSISNLIKFIAMMNTDFATGTVLSVAIDAKSTDREPYADIRLIVYAYEEQ